MLTTISIRCTSATDAGANDQQDLTKPWLKKVLTTDASGPNSGGKPSEAICGFA